MWGKYFIKFFFVINILITNVISDNLDKSDRNLTELALKTIDPEKRIHSIDASNNRILNIEPNEFETFKILIVVDLSHNNDFDVPKKQRFLISETIEIFKCDNCGLNYIYCQTFTGLPNLKALYLSNNHIMTICDDAFQENKVLNTLILDGNKLKAFSGELFADLESFRILSMNSNFEFNFNDVGLDSKSISNFTCNFCGFKEITENTFKKMPNISIISLNNNGIAFVSPDSFQLNAQLEHIELEHNTLQSFPYNVFANFTPLKTICLDYNPFKSSLENNKLKVEYIKNFRDGCPNKESDLNFENKLVDFIATNETSTSMVNHYEKNNFTLTDETKKECGTNFVFIYMCIIILGIIQIIVCSFLWSMFKGRLLSPSLKIVDRQPLFSSTF